MISLTSWERRENEEYGMEKWERNEGKGMKERLGLGDLAGVQAGRNGVT